MCHNATKDLLILRSNHQNISERQFHDGHSSLVIVNVIKGRFDRFIHSDLSADILKVDPFSRG